MLSAVRSESARKKKGRREGEGERKELNASASSAYVPSLSSPTPPPAVLG